MYLCIFFDRSYSIEIFKNIKYKNININIWLEEENVSYIIFISCNIHVTIATVLSIVQTIC